MYTSNAYLNNSTLDIKDKSKPLIVTSCGTYHLFTKPKLPTWRPRGRLDFQLLYIAAGKAHFHFDGKEKIVTAGHMVLYRPKEPQKYEYYGEDQTEVYWVHFTGSDVTNILNSYGLTKGKHVFYCGKGLDYQNHFRTMIQELQMCKDHYEQMLEMHLRTIFIMMHRHLMASTKLSNSPIADDIDAAVMYFNQHYNEEICIEEYAESNGISTSWFIRKFKEYTGFSPLQYILSIRIYNAEALLKDDQHNVTEISSIVGYDNPLYFSRIFKKVKGLSPSEYRKSINKSLDI
ncbi:MAG: helix-turn-helix transcriptional regulator [Lachnospiraceae bacterium]|nr:helix-turn-helix transcriptional regulator [Lachnospiraceae bacterium]